MPGTVSLDGAQVQPGMIKLPFAAGGEAESREESLCAWCRSVQVLEPHSMAVVIGGARLAMDARGRGWGPSARMRGFLSFCWHGAHDGGIGADRDFDISLPITEDTVGGQFGLCFCSTACLRAFLNFCVDELERGIDQERTRLNRKSAGPAVGDPS